MFFLIIIKITVINFSYSADNNSDFNEWLNTFKLKALSEGVSKETVTRVFKNVVFLEQVIKYDRKQPEFFEDTITYVGKRANKTRQKKAKKLLKKNKNIFNIIEDEFSVDKEILLALWGIETNFGENVGKMDIVSSLATLSYDKRRRDFFSSQLITLLKLVDKKLLDHRVLFGSWAGAYGNFQFMPSTIEKYAIDYNGDSKIELKISLEDSLASAANYINKIGWNYSEPCFYRVKLNKKINNKYFNTSARNIKNRLPISKWKKMGVENYNDPFLNSKLKAALILPDNKEDSPAYLVLQNYEKILKWNRSLRFGISVCTLANMIEK